MQNQKSINKTMEQSEEMISGEVRVTFLGGKGTNTLGTHRELQMGNSALFLRNMSICSKTDSQPVGQTPLGGCHISDLHYNS